MSTETPPTVDGLPVVGNTLAFVRDPFGFYERAGTHGDVVRTRVFGREVYQVRHPESIRRILVEEPDRFAKSAILKEAVEAVTPEGLVAVEGDQWRRLRDTVQPAFTARAVQGYATAMAETSVEHAERLAATDGTVDAMDRAKALSLGVLGRALFGEDFERVAEPVGAATRAINDKLDVTSPSRLLPTWVPTPTNRRFREATAAFDSVIEELVTARRAREDPGEDLLGTLVEHASGDDPTLTDAELRDQLFTFLFAGHETTATALAYTWLLLARNPDAQDRLLAEVDRLDGPPGPEDVGDLGFTGRVVDEALRLYPPAHALFREPETDVVLRGYHVPAGVQLSLPAYFVHRDDRWWTAPDRFRPDRWLGEDDRPEYAYFPFGGGPRACIGSRFARLELQLALATVARHVRFELPPDQTPTPDLRMSVTLQPATPIELRPRVR